jgi:hypothetical protein
VLATERQARDPEEAATAPPYGKAVTVSSAAGVTVTLTARTDGEWGGPGVAPGDVRLRRGLKELGRRFGLRAAWPEPAPCAVCPLAGGGRGK